jgi:hypothetical protein
MADKQLAPNEKGNFDDLKINAVDPSDIINDPEEPRNGLPRFLSWSRYNKGRDDEYWQAEGKDHKIYKIVSDEAPKPKKKGKVEIIG